MAVIRERVASLSNVLMIATEDEEWDYPDNKPVESPHPTVAELRKEIRVILEDEYRAKDR